MSTVAGLTYLYHFTVEHVCKQQRDTPDPRCFGCTYCHSSLKRWVKAVFMYLRSWYSPSHSLPIPLHLAWRLWHPDRGSAWKQTAAAAPVTGARSMRCRVSRSSDGCLSMLGHRCLADRYHNHTSPLLSLTYWIKHLPSCSRIAHPPQNLEGKRLLEVSLTRV